MIGTESTTESPVYEIREAAKELAIPIGEGKVMGPNQLYAFMRNTGMIIRRKDPVSGWYYHAPYQRHVDAGRLRLDDRPTALHSDRGKSITNRMTIVTATGLVYLKKRILEAIEAGSIHELVSG